MNYVAIFMKTCEIGRECYKNKCKILAKLSNNHHLPHQRLQVRNDYEKKKNYDWPNIYIWIMKSGMNSNRQIQNLK